MLWLALSFILVLASPPGGTTDWLALTASSKPDPPDNVLTWTVGPTIPSVSSPTPSPVLYFTDLASGPRSGNGDTSKGQVANQDGALVTVWGANLGSAQGTSTITLGGVTPTAIYYWGNATAPNCGAATLFNGYQRLQCVVFQVEHSTPTGAQNIVVAVNGIASNPLPFTVQATGRILFAASGGGGAGTFGSPYGSIQAGFNALNSGDILYVKDGLNAPGGITVPASSHWRVATAPLAIVAYPGAAVRVGDSTHDGIGITCSGCGYWMTYAKLTVFGAGRAVPLADNGRIVGAQIETPLGVGSTGALEGFGNNLFILGTEFTNCGTSVVADFDRLYHVVYLGGRRSVATPQLESGREIGWNYFHGNKAARAVNIYNDAQPGQNYSNPIGGHRVHDNVITDQQWDGIMLGVGTVGENWIYNNLLINTGQEFTADFSGDHNGINLKLSYPAGVTPTGPIIGHVFNNTILNAGNPRSTARGAFNFGSSLGGWTPDLHNNVVLQANGYPYLNPAQTPQAADAAKWSNNLWYGAGAAPAWDTKSVNANPLLVSAVSPYDLHLRATSPAIGAGANMTSRGVGLLDFDGRPRPASGAWSIGAYQLGTQAAGVGASGQDPAPTGPIAPIRPATSSDGTTETPKRTASELSPVPPLTPPQLRRRLRPQLRRVKSRSPLCPTVFGRAAGT